MEIIKNPNIDFLGKAKYFIALSVLLIGVGVFYSRPASSVTASSSRAAPSSCCSSRRRRTPT